MSDRFNTLFALGVSKPGVSTLNSTLKLQFMFTSSLWSKITINERPFTPYFAWMAKEWVSWLYVICVLYYDAVKLVDKLMNNKSLVCQCFNGCFFLSKRLQRSRKSPEITSEMCRKKVQKVNVRNFRRLSIVQKRKTKKTRGSVKTNVNSTMNPSQHQARTGSRCLT